MEPIKALNQTLGTLAQLPTHESKESFTQESLKSEKPNFVPSASKWQRKWLNLDCRHPQTSALGDAAERFCGRWYRNNPERSLLVIVGESGCGKTHTAMAISRFCHLAAFKAFESGKGKTWSGARIPCQLFVFWPETVDQIKAKNFGLVEDMRETDLLIIDDLGAEDDPFRQATNTLCQILSRREKKFTVITTNIKPEFWCERLDSRIGDRLMRNSETVSMWGVPSYQTI